MEKSWALGLLGGALAACLPGVALAWDAGYHHVTTYAYGDNSCGASSDQPGDCMSTSGRAGDWRAVYSTNNTYDHPTTLAVAQSWLTGSGPGPSATNHYFQTGDRVLIEGLGWFRVEDSCYACQYEDPGRIDAWLGFASEYDQTGPTSITNLGAGYHVYVFHQGEYVPSTYKNMSAGATWLGPTWIDGNRQGSYGWIWVDSELEQWSDIIVDGLVGQGSQGTYNHYVFNGETVLFGPYDAAQHYSNSSDCSGFLSTLLARSYGFPNRRSAAQFYGQITNPPAGSHFTPVLRIDQVSPGDILAVRYASDDPSGSTGHVAVVEANSFVTSGGVTALKLHDPPTAPLISNYLQYEITIVDSSSSYHGTTDTRYNGGTIYDGAGRGVMRLYANPSTKQIVGYTWSLGSSSKYYGVGSTEVPNRDVAIGRYTG